MTAALPLVPAGGATTAPLAAYRLFLDPLPLWDYWVWLLLPLCLGVAIVYKSVRVDAMSRVPLAAVKFTIQIVIGMALAAGALLVLVKVLSR